MSAGLRFNLSTFVRYYPTRAKAEGAYDHAPTTINGVPATSNSTEAP